MYKFAAASEHELIVFGAARPGYANESVRQWIEYMQNQGIRRICCLLPEAQLTRYSDLLVTYRKVFGLDQVCWTPIKDFTFVEPEIFVRQILPFLATANQQNEKVVVHCSGGIGRTGHVLAAWLVAGRGFSSQSAISAVKKTGRNPYEAIVAAPLIGRNPWKVAAELDSLLDECKGFRHNLI
ncbi:MAG TPA: dual specificity protein phosphatase family protein [Stenomitos sp.]